ncbi:MAG: 30S ribosomal protein S20 [Patescibacteria group bacterium]|jgi:small subunit ribosomal protein S20
MPNLPSAKKELRKSIKRREKNQKVITDLRKLVKKAIKAIEAKDAGAKKLLTDSLKAIDKAAQKRIIKKNNRDRKKSRLHIRYNKVFSEKK